MEKTTPQNPKKPNHTILKALKKKKIIPVLRERSLVSISTLGEWDVN